MIIITGPGRSGTSVLARLYQELGFDPGGNWIPEARAGLEHGDFWRLNNKLAAAAGFTMPHARKRDSSKPAKARMVKWGRVNDVLDEHGETMVRLARENAVVKDPRFQWTLPLWLRAGAPIDFVVITIRAMSDMVASRYAAGLSGFDEAELRNMLTYGLGLVTAAVHEYDVPHSFIRFPDFIHDVRMLYDGLAFPEPVDYDRFSRVAAQVFDPSQVHDWSDAVTTDA